MRRYVAAPALILCVAASGCARSEPMLSGGKPVAYWVEATKAPDAKLRKTAVFKLGNVGPADPAALTAVLAALADRVPAVRCEAILAVLKFGEQAREAEPRLAELARQDPDIRVRSYAAKALAKIRGNGQAGQ